MGGNSIDSVQASKKPEVSLFKLDDAYNAEIVPPGEVLLSAYAFGTELQPTPPALDHGKSPALQFRHPQYSSHVLYESKVNSSIHIFAADTADNDSLKSSRPVTVGNVLKHINNPPKKEIVPVPNDSILDGKSMQIASIILNSKEKDHFLPSVASVGMVTGTSIECNPLFSDVPQYSTKLDTNDMLSTFGIPIFAPYQAPGAIKLDEIETMKIRSKKISLLAKTSRLGSNSHIRNASISNDNFEILPTKSVDGPPPSFNIHVPLQLLPIKQPNSNEIRGIKGVVSKLHTSK